MPLDINIFTYKGDEDILYWCVMCARITFPEAKIHIIDDANSPIAEDVKNAVLVSNKGISYRKSSFNRGGNLRGRQCVIGELSSFIESSQSRIEGYTMKLDCDTLIFGREWYNIFTACKDRGKNLQVCGSSRSGSTFSGVCYVLSNEIIFKIFRGAHILEGIDDKACEDTVIGAFAALYASPQLLFIDAPGEEGRIFEKWAPWGYDEDRIKLTDIHKTYEVCTFGNFPFLAKTKKDRKKAMAQAAMAYMESKKATK